MNKLTASIGYYRDDGDFALLMTFNNTDKDIPQSDFESIIFYLQVRTQMFFNPNVKIIILWWQEHAPDYITMPKAGGIGEN